MLREDGKNDLRTHDETKLISSPSLRFECSRRAKGRERDTYSVEDLGREEEVVQVVNRVPNPSFDDHLENLVRERKEVIS